MTSTNTTNTTTDKKSAELLNDYEEDDLFEEFNEENWDDRECKENLNIKTWKEDFENEGADVDFDQVLKAEIEKFKNSQSNN